MKEVFEFKIGMVKQVKEKGPRILERKMGGIQQRDEPSGFPRGKGDRIKESGVPEATAGRQKKGN